MSRKALFFFPLILVLVMTACGPAKTRLTANDNGRQVEVKAGDLIVISLDGNPSTGYTWEASDLDTAMFAQVGETEFKSDSPGLVGAGGTLTLTFEALRAGSATLTLIYHRPWETDVEPLDTFSITVVVE